jgi:hypothetical protein
MDWALHLPIYLWLIVGGRRGGVVEIFRRFKSAGESCRCGSRLQAASAKLISDLSQSNVTPDSSRDIVERVLRKHRQIFAMKLVEANSRWKQEKALIAFFVAWKFILFIIVALSPGPGYDTSALVLFNPSRYRHDEFKKASISDRLIINLFRWDVFYFVKATLRDKVYEQEWAFSWAYSQLLRITTQRKTNLPLLRDHILIDKSVLIHQNALIK